MLENRLYATVSTDLSRRIKSGEFAIGDRLPAERLLAVQYRVSRPTIREAIIALEVDGMVEVRHGSGVHIIASEPSGGRARDTDIGAFELTEARRLIEAECCALAATRITETDLQGLHELLALIARENGRNVVAAEAADRRFHLAIAAATGNGAMIAAVELLWDARSRSPQYRLVDGKSQAAGHHPSVAEHAAIVAALAQRDPDLARKAMQNHLARVLRTLLDATETEELDAVRERAAQVRSRYAASH